MAKSDVTREKVLDTALRLLREHGYEATTMRMIATAAGVSTGNAYYYFPSKDHLVQELYRTIQDDHRAAATPILDAGGSLAVRLRGVMHAGLEVFEPYHRFGRSFLTIAIRPGTDASPFSGASAEARETSLAIFRDVVEGARPAVPAAVRGALPELLWYCWLGVTLFWVNDSSPGSARTRRLVDGAVPILARVVRAARVPGVRRTVDEVLALVGAVKS